MPATRTPGTIGLWDDSSGSPRMWPRGGETSASPSGAAVVALAAVGSAGALALLDESSDAAAHAPNLPSKPPERYRFVEVQTEVVRVRVISLWQARAIAMVKQYQEDPNTGGQMIRTVRREMFARRDRLLEFLIGYLDSVELGDSEASEQLRGLADKYGNARA